MSSFHSQKAVKNLGGKIVTFNEERRQGYLYLVMRLEITSCLTVQRVVQKVASFGFISSLTTQQWGRGLKSFLSVSTISYLWTLYSLDL